ncbi:cytotoxic granule associated RNA binding protein TIA1 [Procambarus clarkii]|uniref:cytotoxic granule associated RNA binding protein TIA1 n=1 Tax=Procambarus clarkii TaxID=6728 RepID=UPI0037421DF5
MNTRVNKVIAKLQVLHANGSERSNNWAFGDVVREIMSQFVLAEFAPGVLRIGRPVTCSHLPQVTVTQPDPGNHCVAQSANQKPLTFDDVYNQSSPTNCTVYCGGITNGLSEELMQKTFAPYGQIHEIRVFKDKGYAFVRFSTKESATHAIVSVHNSEINGQPVKCSWGKESGDPNNTPVTTQVMTLTDVSECLSLQPLPGSQYPYNYAGQMGYWYPQGYPPQVQSQQFLGMQGFAYGQYGYQQGMAGMAGVPAWQGVPQPQLPTGQMPQLQQPASMVGAYPVQQFQLSSPYLLGSTPGTLVQ